MLVCSWAHRGLFCVHSRFAIILMGKRELVALLSLSLWCVVIVVLLFLTVPWVCLQFVIVVFPDHTHLLFFTVFYFRPVAYKISDGILLTLSHPSRYILKGKAAIQPLVGSVKILGHILRDSAGKAYDVYSPECHSLITLETVTGSRNRDHIMRTVRHIAKEGTLHYLKRKLKRDSSDTVVLKISELFPSLVGIVRTLPSCRELFNIEGNADSAVNRALSSVGLELVQNTSVPYLEVTDEMRDAIDDWIEALSHSSKGEDFYQISQASR